MYTAFVRCQRPSRFRGRCSGRGHTHRTTGLDVSRHDIPTRAKVAIEELRKAGYYAWFWHCDGRGSGSERRPVSVVYARVVTRNLFKFATLYQAVAALKDSIKNVGDL